MINRLRRMWRRERRVATVQINTVIQDAYLPGFEHVRRELERYKSAVTPMDMDAQMAGEPVPFNLRVNLDVLGAVNWVYDCIREIVNNGKRVPLRVYAEGGTEEIRRNALAKLIRQPNPWMTRRQMVASLLFWLETTGNAYVWKAGAKENGRPKALFILDPRRVQVIPAEDGTPAGYLYTPGGKPHQLKEEEVIHLKGLDDPDNPFYGTCALQLMRGVLQSESYRQRYDLTFFENGARLSGIFKAPQKLADNVFKRVKQEIVTLFTGVDNHHKVGVFEEVDFQPLGLSQKDMDFVALARFNRDRILAAFGVPRTWLGLSDDVNRATAEVEENLFWDKMKSRLDDIQEQLTLGLVEHFGPYELRFDEVGRKNMAALVQVAKTMAETGVYTINEIRAATGHEPIPGGDGWAAVQASQPAGAGGQEEEGQKAEDPRPPRALINRFESQRENFIQQMIRKHAPRIRRFFDAQERRVKRVIQVGGKAEDDYQFTAEEVWDQVTEDLELTALLTPLHLEVMKYAYALASELFFDEDRRFDVTSPGGQAIMRAIGQKITRINETTRDAVREVVMKGMQHGLSIEQIAEGDPGVEIDGKPYPGVAGVFADARGRRAETIARSETADAYNMATLQAYEDFGVTQVYVMDGVDYDEDCRKANGSTWPMEKAKKNLKEHPNCRRAFAPVILGEKSLSEQWRKGGVDWLESKLEILEKQSPKA